MEIEEKLGKGAIDLFGFWRRINRKLALATTTFALVSLIHLPKDSFTALFDKNAAIQFLTAGVLGSVIAILLVVRSKFYIFSIPLLSIVTLLLIALGISTFLSKNWMQGLTGDTFRHNGVAALFFLVIAAALHGFFSFREINGLVITYVGIIALVAFIGFLQWLGWIELPGIQGTVTSTFGNLDFLSAYLGTTLPLWLIAFMHFRMWGRVAVVAGCGLSILVIFLAGAKQGILDIALTILGLLLILLLSKLPKKTFNLSLGLKTAIFSVLLLLWLEFIFAFPFADLKIPQFSDDPQVAIRGVMWLAALNQFRAHPFFGVGPDQYGDYYEQYRTSSSVAILPADSSNDAHSAPLQVLATLGISGATLFAILMVFVIYSLLRLHRDCPDFRKTNAFLALFFFVYITNAAISPTIIANKFLFWSLGGFVIARALSFDRKSAHEFKLIDLWSKSLLAIFAATLIFTSTLFARALYQYNEFGDFNRISKGKYQSVQLNSALPCQYYFPTLLKFSGIQKIEDVKELSVERISSSPRCYNALLRLAGIAAAENELTDLRRYIYQLIEIAPARREVLDAATYYAIRAKDKELEAIVKKQFAKMGITILDVTQ